jgi:hypothetical protein
MTDAAPESRRPPAGRQAPRLARPPPLPGHLRPWASRRCWPRRSARLPEVDAVEPRTGRVAFGAPFDTVYAALLRLRVAESLRVYLLHDEAAGSFPMLHDHLARVRWPLWLPDASA